MCIIIYFMIIIFLQHFSLNRFLADRLALICALLAVSGPQFENTLKY